MLIKSANGSNSNRLLAVQISNAKKQNE